MPIRYLSDMSNESPGKKAQITNTVAGTSDWFIIDRHPDGAHGVPITIGVNPTAGNAKAQMTNDSITKVLASAAPMDWGAGSVTSMTLLEIPSKVSAVRLVSTDAAEMTIQRD